MELTIRERQLLADFRQLSPAEQDELLQKVSRIKKYSSEKVNGSADQPPNRCQIAAKPDKRPEVASEPIFTE